MNNTPFQTARKSSSSTIVLFTIWQIKDLINKLKKGMNFHVFRRNLNQVLVVSKIHFSLISKYLKQLNKQLHSLSYFFTICNSFWCLLERSVVKSILQILQEKQSQSYVKLCPSIWTAKWQIDLAIENECNCFVLAGYTMLLKYPSIFVEFIWRDTFYFFSYCFLDEKINTEK